MSSLVVTDLAKGYQSRQVVKNISLRVDSGEVVGLRASVARVDAEPGCEQDPGDLDYRRNSAGCSGGRLPKQRADRFRTGRRI